MSDHITDHKTRDVREFINQRVEHRIVTQNWELGSTILFPVEVGSYYRGNKMIDECVNISGRTWTRTVENISKVGYSDGVCDGQNKSFQNSFDMGYCQGLEFGLDLGFKLAIEHQSKAPSVTRPADLRSINCNICLDQTTISQNVVNLYNTQKEKNDQYFKETNN